MCDCLVHWFCEFLKTVLVNLHCSYQTQLSSPMINLVAPKVEFPLKLHSTCSCRSVVRCTQTPLLFLQFNSQNGRLWFSVKNSATKLVTVLATFLFFLSWIYLSFSFLFCLTKIVMDKSNSKAWILLLCLTLPVSWRVLVLVSPHVPELKESLNCCPGRHFGKVVTRYGCSDLKHDDKLLLYKALLWEK